jgi:hypothetical protein
MIKFVVKKSKAKVEKEVSKIACAFHLTFIKNISINKCMVL